MRTVSYRLGDLARATINIGKVAENEYTRVQFNAEQIFAEYPAATPSMTVISPAGVKYPAVVTREGDLIIWDVTDADLTAEGMGELQLTLTENGVVCKSYIARTRIERSIVADGEAPDPVQNWLDQAAEVLEEVQEAIPAGGTQGQVMGKLSNDDYDIGWIDQTGGGGGGGTSNYNELSNKPQIAGTTLTGNKSLEQLGIASADAVGAKYTKPSSGIPSSDMAGAVQTSLGKADSAYQKPSSGIPASDLASGVIPDVSGFYTKPQSGIPATDIADGVIPDVSGLYTKPSGGIPKTDLASGVQTSLGNADTAYQKPSGGIPAADIASGVIPVLTDLIDDTAGDGDTDKVWSADKSAGEVSTLSSAITPMQTASASDVGKALSPKTVSNGKVTEWQYLPSPKWELINEETFSFETSSTKTISVDSYGNDLELTDIVLMFETPKQATESAKTSPIVIYYANNNNNNIVTYVTAWTQAANASANGCFVFVESKDGLVIAKARQKSANTSGATAQYFYQEGFTGNDQSILLVDDFKITSIQIRGVTGTGHYKLFGKRKA